MIPSAIRLRPARPADRAVFFAIRRDAFKSYLDALSGWDDARERAVSDDELAAQPIDIIEAAGIPIGYLCVEHHPDHDFLDAIALLATHRGHGIGTMLVREQIARSQARGVPLRLSVLVNNPARRFYERLGFTVTAIEPPRIQLELPARPR